MASSRAIIASFVIVSLLLFQFSYAQQTGSVNGALAPAPQEKKIDCASACGERCKKTKRPNLCKRSCGSCCDRCNCVPPGTYGNLEACPCYANLTTRNKIRKCP